MDVPCVQCCIRKVYYTRCLVAPRGSVRVIAETVIVERPVSGRKWYNQPATGACRQVWT